MKDTMKKTEMSNTIVEVFNERDFMVSDIEWLIDDETPEDSLLPSSMVITGLYYEDEEDIWGRIMDYFCDVSDVLVDDFNWEFLSIHVQKERERKISEVLTTS